MGELTSKQLKAEELTLGKDSVIRDLIEVKNRCLQPKPTRRKDEAGNTIYRFDAAGALSALELLGKHLGMFKEKARIEVEPCLQAVLAVLPDNMQSQILAKLTELAKKD